MLDQTAVATSAEAPPESLTAGHVDEAVAVGTESLDEAQLQRRRDARFVEFFEVVKAYPNPYGDDFVVVDGFNFIMNRGEVVSVIGHSGCGKSTVLTMMAGLNAITSGGIAVDGREIDGPGPDRSVVFQAPCLLPWMTAFQNVMLGVDNVYRSASKADRRQLAEYYLSVVGLADSMHRYPRELSGGMQQRVGIARAIALKPKTLLLDEPFGRLDSLTRMELQDVILDILDREKVTTILVTHDVDEAIYMSDRVCMMTNGPRARVGQVLRIPFERPRRRSEVLEHPDFYDLRGCLLSFLEGQEKRKESKPATTVAVDEALKETKVDIKAAKSAEPADVPAAPDPLVRVVEIWQPSEDGRGLTLTEGLYHGVPEFEEASAGSTFDEGEGLPGAVWKSERPIVFDDLGCDAFVRSDAATACGLTAGIGIPVFDGHEVVSVVLLLCNNLGDAKGAIESWHPDLERRELALGHAYYANLERFRMISEYAQFPMGSGLPGAVWGSGRPKLETNLLDSPGFIRSSGAEADGLGTALGIPVVKGQRELRSVLVLLSSADRPIGRGQFIWNVEGDEESLTCTPAGSATTTCPWLTAAVEEKPNAVAELALRVAEERRAVLFRDLSSSPLLAKAASHDGLTWALGIPVLSEGRVVSVCLLMD